MWPPGYIFDYVRQLNLHVSLFGFEPTSYQQLFIVSLVFEIVLFPVIYFIRRGAEATNGGPVIDESSRNRGAAAFLEWYRSDSTEKRDGYRASFSAADQSICLLPVARFFFSSSDFSKRSFCRWIMCFRSSAFANSD